MNYQNKAVKNEILHSLPNKICCKHSFLTGFLSGCSQKIDKIVYRPHQSIKNDVLIALKSILPKEAEVKMQISKLIITNICVSDFKCKFTERLKKIILEGRTKHCLVSFLQGLFLQSGYIQNPNNGYHLEISIRKKWLLAAVKLISKRLKIPFHYCRHKKYRIAYIKSIEDIILFMNKLSLFSTALELSEIYETNNLLETINRQVNFETANINRTVNAASDIIERINKLLAHSNQDIWSEALRNTALLRKEFPLDSLEQLGKYFIPELSKSAINHRLRRINNIYKKIFTTKADT